MSHKLNHCYYRRSLTLNIGTPKMTSLLFVFVLVAIASGLDLASDLSHGATFAHIIKEAVIVTLSLLALAWIVNGLRLQKKAIELLQQELENAEQLQQQPGKYILESRRRMGEVINQQFEEWQLTSSEKEVGMLLLKGLSLKEIAIIRNTLEKTVRQQASAIYKKASVTGRHAFAAWFIEDLL